jgi:hypothetical protein
MHFMFGAMSYALAGNDALKLIATCDAEGADDAEAVIRRLIPFLTGGFEAPCGDLSRDVAPPVIPDRRAA